MLQFKDTKYMNIMDRLRKNVDDMDLIVETANCSTVTGLHAVLVDKNTHQRFVMTLVPVSAKRTEDNK